MKISLPDDHLRYPRDEFMPYLDWYRGKFAGVFVALHPFFKIEGIAPEDVDWGTHAFERADIPASTDLLSELERLSALRSYGKIAAEDVEALIPHRAEVVTWEEIRQLSDLATLGEVNRALSAGIKALKRKFVDLEGLGRLERACRDGGIFQPTEGRFQVLHRGLISGIFKQAASPNIIGEDISETRYVHEELFGVEWDHSQRRLWASDESMLVVVDWDSFFTLICMSEDRLMTVDLSAFDGFWAEGSAGHHWWMPEAERNML